MYKTYYLVLEAGKFNFLKKGNKALPTWIIAQ